jgi:aspartyl-tRNA synthetase
VRLKYKSLGDIVLVSELTILNAALTPPFTIEDETDGGEDIRDEVSLPRY